MITDDNFTATMTDVCDQLVIALVDGLQCGGKNVDKSLIDVVEELAYETGRIATAITPPVAGGTDATGGRIESVTEAVMGVTAGLCRIADAIESLAEAFRSKSS